MVFIVGGKAQGKLEYALNIYKGREQKNPAVCDGAVCTPEELRQAEIVDHLHEFIRRYPESELCLRKDAVVICDEVGSGIVPLDREERIFRDRVGRTGCRIAAEADCVIRIVYGLPVYLKGEPDFHETITKATYKKHVSHIGETQNCGKIKP